ncbi:cationic amino acid transporter 4-like [Lytechinus variegatus]|uniref:cationic amino acid transporter 4-like n=1 Tax=Lytechinus variegatus TaxID=7654 RepID=UPI001BB25D25|nr:cationic amino acid transporter 4-like [Lytechinus variegatus]
MPFCRDLLSRISQRKPLGSDRELFETPLERSLNAFQLCIMGMGAMFGSGLYVLTGVEVKEVTGPAIIISYAIASVAAMLSAFCYVEFACRIPRTGSAYTFAYLSLGELWAFVIGWDLILEYVITAAAVASSITGYVDSLTGYVFRNFTVNVLMEGQTWEVPYLAPYPNIFACVAVVLVAIIIITGAKISSWVTAVCMAINIGVIAVIVVMGFTQADISNWEDYGGFVPNGSSSIIAGAATLFFSFVGFDAIAMANEEALNPRKSIPMATLLAIVVTGICYILASAVLTLLVPYTELDEQSAFASAFQARGIEWARWLVGVGAICAMFSALSMNLYCIPRTLYAISSDGLLFSCLSIVNSHTHVPVYATLLAMFLASIPATFVPLVELVEFISIGVLVGYAFVAGALIFLRYGPEDLRAGAMDGVEMPSLGQLALTNNNSGPVNDSTALLDTTSTPTPGTLKHQFHSTPLLRELLRFEPGVAVKISLLSSILFLFGSIAVIEHASQEIAKGEWWAVLLLLLFGVCALGTFLIITLHYQNEDTKQYYRVPLVPVLPWLSIVCNIVLMLKLRKVTWLRYLVWLIAGLTIYASYGYRHSKVGMARQQNQSSGETYTDDVPADNSATYGSTEQNDER